MALRPQQLPLDRDFVVDRCFVLFVRARACSPVGFPPAVGWLLPGRPEAVLAGLLLSPWMRILLCREAAAEPLFSQEVAAESPYER